MDSTSLHTRLMEDARRYDPVEHTRGLLSPYRDVLLLWRAKFMSYEQIAAAFGRHGLRVSPAAVGIYCRRNFTKSEILRERQRIEGEARSRRPDTPGQLPLPAPVAAAAALGPGKRGPKIARDDY